MGMRGVRACRRTTLPNTWTAISDIFITQKNRQIEAEFYGGIIFIKNIDNVQTLLLDSLPTVGQIPLAAEGFPILPGETLVLDLKDKIAYLKDSDNFSVGEINKGFLLAAAAAGNCALALMGNFKDNLSDNDYALDKAISNRVIEMDG